MTKNPNVFAFLETSRGPENMIGVGLHVVKDHEVLKAELLAVAREKGDKRWERNILLQSEDRQNEEFITPQVDWWMSEDHFYGGSKGFRVRTIENVYRKYEHLVLVEEGRAKAIEMARNLKRHQEQQS